MYESGYSVECSVAGSKKYIIGIDPGLRCTGWGVIEVESQSHTKLRYHASGVIRTSSVKKQDRGAIAEDCSVMDYRDYAKLMSGDKRDGGTIAWRITRIYGALSELFTKFNISGGAIENTYTNINSASSLKLAHARAAAIIAAYNGGVVLQEYPAKTIKKMISGDGNADKEQLQRSVLMHLPNVELSQVKCSDESDALAIAICCAYDAMCVG